MKNQNSVCFVSKISEIKPINGADKIVLAVIEGWECIVKKDQHTVGELVVVATTDAIIPEKIAEEMNITSYLRKGNRVKTIKLRNVYSECLIIPFTFIDKKGSYEYGDDMMEVLGVSKFEPEVKTITLAKGKKIRYQSNPAFHVYYKFPNIKNVPNIFNEDDVVQITRKIHGTNARYGIVKKLKLSFLDKTKKFLFNKGIIKNKNWEFIEYEYIYGSHNVEKGSDSQGYYSTDVWKEVADKLKIKEKLFEWLKNNKENNIGSGIILYGEVFGPGIQKNFDYNLKELKFNVFDITIDNKYQPTLDTTLITQELDLEHVEILYVGNWNKEIQDKFVFNNFIKGTKVPHEGIVVKHTSGKREKVAKVINPDYLIYGEKNNVGDSH